MLCVRNVCLILICAATLALAAPPPAPSMELRFDRLTSALTLLSDSDRKIVDEAVQLIREGEHVGALTGAFDESTKAHEAPNGNSYRCYFLARIAFLTVDSVTCRRELNHAKNAGDMPEDIRQLQNDLKKAKAKS